MKKFQFEYGILGLIVGIAAGALVGFLFLNQIKKGARSEVAQYVIPMAATAFGLSGIGIGRKLGKEVYIDTRTGIGGAGEDEYFKNGKYWVGVTKWVDKRDGQLYVLLTGRSNIKSLVTVLNDRPIIIHNCQSASKVTVPKFHSLAKGQVWKKLRKAFTEHAADYQKLFPDIGD